MIILLSMIMGSLIAFNGGLVSHFFNCRSVVGGPMRSENFNFMPLENQGQIREFDNQFHVGTLLHIH